MPFCPPWYFWVIATIIALFHGFYGFVFHWTGRDNTKALWNWTLLFFQTWFNFAGSAMGWFAAYALYWRLTNPASGGLGWFDIVLALAAGLGISGHLPQLLAGIAGTPAVFAEYTSDRLGILFEHVRKQFEALGRKS